MEIKEPTKEEIETYYKVQKFFREEDLQDYLHYNLDREFITEERAREIWKNKEDIIEQFEDYESNNDWRAYFDEAVNYVLGNE